jgi:acetyltransferase-like isoleucine patch superfamily enzyme
MRMGKNSNIGSLNIIKLDNLTIDDFGFIGNLNWITGMSLDNSVFFQREAATRNPSLHVGEHAAITNRHMIDCIDRVSIGKYTTVGGWNTQILTHAIDLNLSRQSCAPVTIGDYCFIGTACIILKGTSIGDRCVLGAGSVASGDMLDADTLYSGVPAEARRKIEGKYFSRPIGFVAECAD